MFGPEQQFARLRDGFEEIISEPELKNLLQRSAAKKVPLRIKYGADPSAPDLHLGHTVALRKLRLFQDLGHTIVFIIGDFTARIGDPAQRSETRPMLSAGEVRQNAKTYQKQVFKILDRAKTEVRYNSEWLARMKSEDFLMLMRQYTVARLLERDDFQKRYQSKQPIALIEFMYPLLQGHDSVVVKADIEVGGTDQKFNLLVGRELQRGVGMAPQVVMTLPLIEGTDGIRKMSKSFNNAIALLDSPREMFGKVMSIPDQLLERYYKYVAALEPEQILAALRELKTQHRNPRDVKADLAEHLVTLYHSREEARCARAEFDQIFKQKGLPDAIGIYRAERKKTDLVSLLKDTGLAASKSEARRLILQGGVRVDRAKVTDAAYEIHPSGQILIQCGKRKFIRVEFDGK